MNSADNRIPDAVVKELIRETECSRLRALVDGDIEKAKAHHAEDFQLITPIGQQLTKEQYLGAIASGLINYVKWEPEAIEVRLYGEVAVIRYQAQLELIFAGYPVPLTRYWHTDTYELHEGSWQVVWSQATEIKTI